MERIMFSESPIARAKEREKEAWEREIEELAGELAWKAPVLAGRRILPAYAGGR